MNRPHSAIPVAVASLALLAACEIQREDTPAPEPTSPGPTASPTAVETSPSASIIRPDITPVPVVDLPPEPLTVTLGFPEGGSELDEAAEKALAGLIQSEQVEEGWPIMLAGHSDSAGSDQANLAASRRRAEAVAEWLVERDIPRERIEIIAFGEQNPVAPNAKSDGTPNEQGRARNRRVEVTVAPPDPQPPDEPSGEEGREESDGA